MDRRELRSWYLFDLANTSFTVMIVTVLYAIYFRGFVAVDAFIQLPWGTRPTGTFLWGLGNAVSMFVVGLTSPYLGALADGTSRKKLFTAIYTALCIAATLLLVTVERGETTWGLLLFILGNIGFQGGLVFYNAFLPQISPPGRTGYVSGMGFAVGYVGALATLALAIPFASAADQAGNYLLMKPAFLISGLFFLFFSIPFFLFVRERPPVDRQVDSALGEGWRRLRETLTHMGRFRQTGRFLAAYFLYSDGINTVIAFGGIYAANTLGMTTLQVILFFALLQVAAIAGAWVFGILTDRWGARPTVEVTLALWLVMTLVAFAARGPGVFYAAGVLAGIAMGSSQAASRSLMAELTPEHKEAEFYGFYGLCGKFSAVLGPLVFGTVSTATGDERWAVLSVTLFFLAGWGMLRRVDMTEGREAIREAAPAPR
ncbi:MAG: MFS transporter [bacterium]